MCVPCEKSCHTVTAPSLQPFAASLHYHHQLLLLLQFLSSMPALENVFLRYTELRGRLNCSMLTGASNLKRFSLSGNMDLVGEVPGCFLQVRLASWASTFAFTFRVVLEVFNITV